MKKFQKQSLMVCNIIAAILFFLDISTSQGSGLSTLNWLADPGTRVTGPSGCVVPTFVMQRPDGKYGMYFYDGDCERFSDTGYATSTDGMNWTYVGRILTHGGNGFDNINAGITHIISLPGGRLRAYCSGMRSNQVPVQTSIFYTETDDPCGVSWPNPRYLLFPEEASIGCPRVYGSAETGYTMYFYSGNQIIRRTSANGIDNWSERQVVIPDYEGNFDIVERPDGSFRMFVGSGGNIKSLTSTDDGLTWTWDTGSRLTPDLYSQTSIGNPVLAKINGTAKMYLYAYPNRQYIYSATPEPPHVLAPNGGESWIAGTTKTVQWQTSDVDTIPNVRIKYSANNGQVWNDVNTVPNTGSYNWLVPQVTSNQCLVRISDAADANIFDVSNNTFIIYQCQLNSKADLNGDCKVDMTDLALFANDWMRNGNPFDPGFTEPPTGMVFIPSGMFQMGDSFAEGRADELPVHSVYLDPFYMGKFEISNGQYIQFLNSALSSGLITVIDNIVYKAGAGTSYPYCDTSSSNSNSQIEYSVGVFNVRTKDGRDMSNDPMVMVSWYGAVAYCNWRSQQEGKDPCYDINDPNWPCNFEKNGYRLPTEAEWEYAARGGLSGKRFPWGDTISQTRSNFHSSSSYAYDVSPVKDIFHPIWGVGNPPYTSPVGFFDGTLKYKSDYNWPASIESYQTESDKNNYGLYDMAGNVAEMCNDWYGGTYYSISPLNNPKGPSSGIYRSGRVGVWFAHSMMGRVAARGNQEPESRGDGVGFRLVRELK